MVKQTVIVYRRAESAVNPIVEAEYTALVQEYFRHRLEVSELSRNTLDKYHHCLKTYQDWLAGEVVSEQSAKAFLVYLRQQGFTSTTIRCYYHALKPFLAYLEMPLQVKFKRQRKLPAYHTPNQVKAILDAIKERDDNWNKLKKRDILIVLMFAYTGIRRGELLSLRVRDLNFHNRMLKVKGKGDKERTIPIADVLYEPLRRHTKRMQPGDRLFPMQPRRVWSIISRYANEAGIDDFHPHSFRHYFATQLVESGESLKVVQELLGHADISTTAIYLDVAPMHLTSAVSKLPKIA